MMTRNALVVAATAAVVLFAAAANAADAKGVKLKVTGVAVVDDTQEGKAKVKFLPPETRIGGLTTGGLGQTDIGNKVGKTGYRRGGAAEYVKHLKSFRK